MRKLIVLGLFIVSIASCGESSNLRLGQAYSIEQMRPDFPNGLKAYEMVGHNWYKGSYEGRPVLIHFVKTLGEINVYFQFIDGGKE